MIERFVDRLGKHVDAMEVALKERNYMELVVSCNWIRGEANTLGFEVLIKPVESIEVQLRQQKFSQIITHISELRNMAERIDVRQTNIPGGAIQYVVPSHARNPVIYENFVSQLGSKILEMEVALAAENFRQMKQICRWINRYGSKIKFVEVIDAVGRLQDAVESADTKTTNEELQSFIELYRKIEIVSQN